MCYVQMQSIVVLIHLSVKSGTILCFANFIYIGEEPREQFLLS